MIILNCENMREIKFRGKEINTCEWVFGFYTQGSFINPNTGKETIRHIIHADFLYDVVPETIGQYTGLKDKDGKEIYEGDIISINDRPFGYIKWNPDGYFYIHTSTICEYQDCIAVGQMIKKYPVEEVGNIYDNPDLLKVKDYEMSRTK